MMKRELEEMAKGIVEQSQTLVRAHANQTDALVNYACIFARSEGEYVELEATASQLGRVAKATPTGNVFQIAPIETAAGSLRLLKIRKSDPTRPERGDADFTLPDYSAFKAKYAHQPGFSLIERPEMEMIELVDPGFPVRAYFSFPTLAQQLGIV